MKRPCHGSLSVFVLSCLVWQISGLARVDHSAYRRPNATHTQWQHHATTKSPIRGSWNAPAPVNQWGRHNQTMGNSNWQRHNQTNQFPGFQQSAVQNPWMRNNQTYHATTVTPNRGWNAPTANQWNQQNNNNHNQTQQFPGFQPAHPTQQNNPWMRNNQTQPSYQPQNPPQNIGWGVVRPNATNYAPTTPANTNGNIGWGSSGFGQPNWHNAQQYPGGVPAQNNFNNGPIPGFSGVSYNQTNGSSGWSSAPAQPQPAQVNSGAVPLAPQWNSGGNVPPQAQGGAVPLAPLAGGTGATTWNAGSQAGLSYANGQQPLPAVNGQQKPGGSSNPYAHLFN